MAKAPKTNARIQRIEAQMQRTLASLLLRGVKDPRVGHVTVTAVTLAPDLSVAQVYFLPFGLDKPAAGALAGLASAAGFLRGEVARELGLRHAPRLEFRIDTQLERSQQLSRLIDTAVSDDRRRAQPDAAADHAATDDAAADAAAIDGAAAAAPSRKP